MSYYNTQNPRASRVNGNDVAYTGSRVDSEIDAVQMAQFTKRRGWSSGSPRRYSKVFFLVLALVAPLITVQPVRAEEYAVSQMVYLNQGAYSAGFYFRWKNSSGALCEAFIQGERVQKSGETAIVELNRQDLFRFHLGTPEQCPLNEGDEAWGFVEIVWGDSDSCRQTAKMRYRRDGGIVRYTSKGTTLDNNRCRIDQKPTTLW